MAHLAHMVEPALGHGQSCCNGGHVALLLDCPIEILRVSGNSDTSCTFIFSQHCRSTFTNTSIINTQALHLTLNLIHTVSYESYITHVVIYIPVFTIIEYTALSLGLCEASDLIGRFMICMLRVR